MLFDLNLYWPINLKTSNIFGPCAVFYPTVVSFCMTEIDVFNTAAQSAAVDDEWWTDWWTDRKIKRTDRRTDIQTDGRTDRWVDIHSFWLCLLNFRLPLCIIDNSCLRRFIRTISSRVSISDFPSLGVTGLTVYFSDFPSLGAKVWKIHCQTCHTLSGQVWKIQPITGEHQATALVLVKRHNEKEWNTSNTSEGGSRFAFHLGFPLGPALRAFSPREIPLGRQT